MARANLHKMTNYFLDYNPYVVKPLPELATQQVYGNKAPPKESFEDICGPPTTCPECPDPKYGTISTFTCYTSASSSITAASTPSKSSYNNKITRNHTQFTTTSNRNNLSYYDALLLTMFRNIFSKVLPPNTKTLIILCVFKGFQV